MAGALHFQAEHVAFRQRRLGVAAAVTDRVDLAFDPKRAMRCSPMSTRSPRRVEFAWPPRPGSSSRQAALLLRLGEVAEHGLSIGSASVLMGRLDHSEKSRGRASSRPAPGRCPRLGSRCTSLPAGSLRTRVAHRRCRGSRGWASVGFLFSDDEVAVGLERRRPPASFSMRSRPVNTDWAWSPPPSSWTSEVVLRLMWLIVIR